MRGKKFSHSFNGTISIWQVALGNSEALKLVNHCHLAAPHSEIHTFERQWCCITSRTNGFVMMLYLFASSRIPLGRA